MSKTPDETVPIPSRMSPETPVSVAAAARLLGITEDGVRKALRRGTLPGSKDERGVWQVHLPPHDESRDRPETRPETSPETGLLALVDQLRSENAYLREELHNTHILLAQMTDRIPALTAGDHRRDPDDEVSEVPQSDPARPGAPGEATERPRSGVETHRESIVISVWRRLFGR